MEESVTREFIVKRFQDFPHLLKINNANILQSITIFVNSMINLVSSLTNITFVVKLMVEITPWNANLIKLMLFVLYFAVIFFIIEPEKLRYFTVASMVIFSAICKFACFTPSVFLLPRLSAAGIKR